MRHKRHRKTRHHKRRRPMRTRASNKSFRRHAKRVARPNRWIPMRGGTRL